MVHGEHHCNGGGGGSYSDDPNATLRRFQERGEGRLGCCVMARTGLDRFCRCEICDLDICN